MSGKVHKRIRYIKHDKMLISRDNFLSNGVIYNAYINTETMEYSIANLKETVVSGTATTQHNLRLEVKKALENLGIRFASERRVKWGKKNKSKKTVVETVQAETQVEAPQVEAVVEPVTEPVEPVQTESSEPPVQ